MFAKTIFFFILSAHCILGKNIFTDLPDPPKADPSRCQLVPLNDRLDCFPENNANQQDCEARGCCWFPPPNLGDLPQVPYCFYQPKAPSYTFKNITELPDGVEAILERSYKSPYSRDVPSLKFEAKFHNDSVLRIKITDPVNKRFETPFPVLNLENSGVKNPLYRLKIGEDQQGFQIIRVIDNVTIFDASDFTNFIYSDQFLQITTKLPSKNIYGLGEERKRFRLSTEWKQITLFNHDTGPKDNVNVYGTHPFYLLIENSTRAHGVLLKNSNGMELVLQSTPALTYRTIGGILDFFVFLGPKPSDVLKQYQTLVGKPHMPAYWSLGFHLCRYGIGDLATTKQTLMRNLVAGIPVETQWNDLDYMNKYNDFTYDNVTFDGLPEFVKDLHDHGRHYVIIVDPGVSGSEDPGTYAPLDRGVEMDVFVKDSAGAIFRGQVWNLISTVFPDFTHPNATAYWTEMIQKFHDIIPFDGIWIDMNEPSNNIIPGGCPDNELESPVYALSVEGGTALHEKTLCMSFLQYLGVHYNLHNLFGISEANVSKSAMDQVLGKRSLIISRSTFVGQGRYSGHWSGDISSTWDDMRYSIPSLLDFSLFGMPLMGADICGFNGDTDEDLCNRWMQLGAFYPFSRNHNSINQKEQDPAALGDKVVKSSIKALRIRYSLLPYLYTLFWQAHNEGTTVARPLVIEFPEDPNTYDIDTSFLWGSALLIAPVLENGANSISVYLPEGMWYDFYTRNQLKSEGESFEIKTDINTIPIFIRGGEVITMQSSENTTEEVRKSGLRLLAALDEKHVATGVFYWDDGISIDVGEDYTVLKYIVQYGILSIVQSHVGETPLPELYSVEVLGLQTDMMHANFVRNYNYTYNETNKSLFIKDLNIRNYPTTIRLY